MSWKVKNIISKGINLNFSSRNVKYITVSAGNGWNTFHIPLGSYILPGFSKYSEEQFIESVAYILIYSILPLFLVY